MAGNRIHAILLVGVSLAIGLLIYYTQRTGDLYINRLLSGSFGDNFLKPLQSSIAGLSVPHHINYSLPDGLWMLALTISILLIWDFRIHRNSLIWIALAFLVGTGFECMQGLRWIEGWFDPVDMIYIMAGVLLPVSFIMIKKRLCNPN